MVKYFIGCALFVFNAWVIGAAMPFLISYKSTELVAVGILLSIALPAINYIAVTKFFIKSQKEAKT